MAQATVQHTTDSAPPLPSIIEEVAALTQREALVRALLLAAGDGARRQYDGLRADIRRLSALETLRRQRTTDGTATTTAQVSTYGELVARIRGIVQAAVPAGSVVVVVSKGDDNLLDFEGREGWHFPQDEHGIYAGYYPADSSEAIAHLESLRTRGAGYFLIPTTGSWWLDHYDAFGRHLNERHRRVWADRRCTIYALTPPAAPNNVPRAERTSRRRWAGVPGLGTARRLLG